MSSAGEQYRRLRCIFGPLLFREVKIDPSLLTKNDSLIPKLARAALEEAGLADAEVLAHLRSGGPHVRGCFALDAVLGNS